MTNLLQRSASWLGAKLQSATIAGRSVIYARGALQSAAIQAVCSDRTEEALDEQGYATWVKRYDWTFVTAELLIRSSAVEPHAGDRIAETLSGEEAVYEVVKGPGNKPCFEWADTSGLLTVVHTNKVR
jgi:hypothetical protein